MADPLVLARAIHLLATMLVTGTVFFDALAAQAAIAGRALARQQTWSRVLLASGLAAALLSGAGWFAVLAISLDASSFGDTAWTLATETQFGAVWMLRLALALLIATSIV